MGNRTTYTSEFKLEAVRLAVSSEVSIASIACELGLKENTLYNWVGQMKQKEKGVVKLGSSKHSHLLQAKSCEICVYSSSCKGL